MSLISRGFLNMYESYYKYVFLNKVDMYIFNSIHILTCGCGCMYVCI